MNIKAILWNKQTRNKRVISFLSHQAQPFWQVYCYAGKHYIQTFQGNVYEVLV